MTKEDKQLLIQDLCARLPYGVKLKFSNWESPITLISINKIYGVVVDGINSYPFETCKPYLFPMSSMTEDRYKEIYEFTGFDVENDEIASSANIIAIFDWLNEHHFDYRGLIDKGLAIDATGLNIY